MNGYLEKGKKVFENIPDAKAPLWGALLLKEFKDSPIEEPLEIAELRELIKSNDWDKSHTQFSKIRNLTLNNQDNQKGIYLLLAENVSKITFNQTETNAPFDSDAGFWIFELATKLAISTNSKIKIDRIEGLLNLFQAEKNDENFFAIEANYSGTKLLKNIFNASEAEMQELRIELPNDCNENEVSLTNPVSRLHKNNENIPNGSFEFHFDLQLKDNIIGYYSLIWDNEIELIDEYFVINKST